MDFDFVGDDEQQEQEIATGGDPTFLFGLTKAQVLEAQRRAESRKGLDMAEFMKETGIANIDFEEVLKARVTEED